MGTEAVAVANPETMSTFPTFVCSTTSDYTPLRRSKVYFRLLIAETL